MRAPITESRRRLQGKMLWFNEVKDFGFIETEEGERLYVHRGAFVEAAPVGRCAGLAVEFEITGDEADRAASGVTIVPDSAHGRARHRRSSGRLR